MTQARSKRKPRLLQCEECGLKRVCGRCEELYQKHCRECCRKNAGWYEGANWKPIGKWRSFSQHRPGRKV